MDSCCIFRLAFGCCPLQTLVEIVIFSIFNGKKQRKRARNLQKKFANNMFFKFAPKRWLTVLFPKKWAFSLKTQKMTILTSVWVLRTTNAGRNIQQTALSSSNIFFTKKHEKKFFRNKRSILDGTLNSWVQNIQNLKISSS